MVILKGVNDFVLVKKLFSIGIEQKLKTVVPMKKKIIYCYGITHY